MNVRRSTSWSLGRVRACAAVLAVLTVASSAALAAPQPGEAKIARGVRRLGTRLTDHAIRLGGRIVPLLTRDRSHQQLTVAGHVSKLALGDLVGSGYFGVVHHLAAPHPVVPEAHADTALVVKIAHAPRWRPLRRFSRWLTRERARRGADSDPPFAITAKRLRVEIETLRFLKERAARIAAGPSYPHAPAWKRGDVPIVPIVATARTNAGLVVFKPLVRGLTLGAINARGGLTADMKRSLRDIYDFAQAVSETISVKPGSGIAAIRELPAAAGGQRLSLDAHPKNLLWVDAPAMLRTLGLSRPSFVFVELDQCVLNAPQYLRSRTSFDDFLREAQRERWEPRVAVRR